MSQDKFPSQIKYIIGNEGCERFSFYGMRTILTAFMVSFLLIEENAATSVYHVFVAGCYLTPLLGAYLADRYFGKYKVILWLSIVYCIGHGVIALFETKTGLYWGLGLIALGSGGIKPCVSAFGGDQIGDDKPVLLQKFYNAFYWIINLGSATSSLLTPWLLKELGPSIAFGVPGILMAIATFIFWMGRSNYVMKPPTYGKNPDTFMKVVLSAWRNHQSGVAFFDGALKNHPSEAVDASRAVVGVMKIFFIAVPVFWALFDQHGSTWVHQARKMDPMFMGFEIVPSQMQALNPWMVMALIPTFVMFIYPSIGKYYNFTPLRRMTAGAVVAAFSFIQVALIEYQLDAGNQLNIMWQFFPYLTITIAEVMISITGLEFAYTQAPPSMKSTLMSFWMLTTFLGNVYVALVAQINVFSGGNFFMFFGLLMLVMAGVFAYLAKSYKMRQYAN